MIAAAVTGAATAGAKVNAAAASPALAPAVKRCLLRRSLSTRAQKPDTAPTTYSLTWASLLPVGFSASCWICSRIEEANAALASS